MNNKVNRIEMKYPRSTNPDDRIHDGRVHTIYPLGLMQINGFPIGYNLYMLTCIDESLNQLMETVLMQTSTGFLKIPINDYENLTHLLSSIGPFSTVDINILPSYIGCASSIAAADLYGGKFDRPDRKKEPPKRASAGSPPMPPNNNNNNPPVPPRREPVRIVEKPKEVKYTPKEEIPVYKDRKEHTFVDVSTFRKYHIPHSDEVYIRKLPGIDHEDFYHLTMDQYEYIRNIRNASIKDIKVSDIPIYSENDRPYILESLSKDYLGHDLDKTRRILLDQYGQRVGHMTGPDYYYLRDHYALRITPLAKQEDYRIEINKIKK